MGATGGQVVRSVVLEAFVIGVAASLLGLLAGIGLGVGLLQLLRELGLDLPATSTVLLARTVVVSLVVGVVVTVLAAVLPAVRAARVPPVAAIADAPRARGRHLRPTGHCRVGRAGGGSRTDRSTGWRARRDTTGLIDQVQVVALGAFAVLVGVVMVLPAVTRPAIRTLGAPLRRLGPPGALARANAMRNPRRTAITASAPW